MHCEERAEDRVMFDADRVKRYKVILRRDRLLGLWVGEQLGKVDCEILDYMASVVQSDFEEPGDVDILRRVHGDLLAAGIKVSEAGLRAKLAELHEQACREVGG